MRFCQFQIVIHVSKIVCVAFERSFVSMCVHVYFCVHYPNGFYYAKCYHILSLLWSRFLFTVDRILIIPSRPIVVAVRLYSHIKNFCRYQIIENMKKKIERRPTTSTTERHQNNKFFIKIYLVKCIFVSIEIKCICLFISVFLSRALSFVCVRSKNPI